jgi:hypothetical protein
MLSNICMLLVLQSKARYVESSDPAFFIYSAQCHNAYLGDADTFFQQQPNNVEPVLEINIKFGRAYCFN